jgi:tRNA1Val (adenine37-N6)-methyltransferase
MKVGTDSMLLGSWVDPGKAATVLDVGTGCGILALMMAQKSSSRIEAIDIHPPSAEEAGMNFLKSPWKERLSSHCISLRDFSARAVTRFDLVISNPPFFSNSLKPGSLTRAISRHEQSLSLRSLLDGSVALMHGASLLCLVLPVTEHKAFIRMAGERNLYIQKALQVRPCPLKPFNRVLLELGFLKKPVPAKKELIISESENGPFTKEYLSLTQEFHYFS